MLALYPMTLAMSSMKQSWHKNSWVTPEGPFPLNPSGFCGTWAYDMINQVFSWSSDHASTVHLPGGTVFTLHSAPTLPTSAPASTAHTFSTLLMQPKRPRRSTWVPRLGEGRLQENQALGLQVTSEKVFGVGARRVQTPSEEVLGALGNMVKKGILPGVTRRGGFQSLSELSSPILQVRHPFVIWE